MTDHQYEEQLDQSGHGVSMTDKPLVIAFINLRSGSGKGDELYEMLKEKITEDNIFIFGKDKPAEVLTRMCTHPDSRVIVCGGDGSVNWILSIIDHLQLTNVSVGIIPNGTGNDTSRYLGWGQRQFGNNSVKQNIQLMCERRCPIVNFDRWQIFFSLNKIAMQKRSARLAKTKEVPATHLWALIDTNETSTIKQREEYLLPKYYRCMMRLDELDFLQRYKYLHHQHWPQTYRQSLCEYSSDTGKYTRKPNPIHFDENGIPQDILDHEVKKNQYRDLLEAQAQWLRFTWSFNNYFSFGIDAQVMNDFGIHRDNNPCCYQCRCCTLMWIGTCSTVTCFQCKKKPLKYRIDLLYKEGDILPIGQTMDETKTQVDIPHPLNQNNENKNKNNNGDIEIQVEVEDLGITNTSSTDNTNNNGLADLSWATDEEKLFLQNPQHLANNYKWLSATFDPTQYGALILLNIPSYAGGVNIWGEKKQRKDSTPWILEDSPQATNDGKIETVGFTGFINMQFTVSTQSSAYRITQLQGLRIYMEDDAFIQLDGEAFIQPAGIVEIYRSESGKMLQNPHPQYPPC